jgi:hypothetical protein
MNGFAGVAVEDIEVSTGFSRDASYLNFDNKDLILWWHQTEA